MILLQLGLSIAEIEKMAKHFKKWIEWRKYNGNSFIYKLLVLFKIVKSPTFECFHTQDEWEEFAKGFEEGLKSGRYRVGE